MSLLSSEDQTETIIVEKHAKMVSPNGGKPYFRTAHFLKPSFPQTLFKPPPKSATTKPISDILKFSSKVMFNGWRNSPLKTWVSWVEKMRALHEQTWRKASIYEAIMSSKLDIPKCRGSVFALAEKWCVETSSFVLPWGEVSVTLEDVMVLGGFSVTGDSVLKGLHSRELLEIEEKLLVARSQMCRSKQKKASQQQWLEMWMDTGTEVEHEAFLSLWLSRYVLAADDRSTINKSVFAVAVVLATGTKLALAPAVLASIYRDLRLLKEKLRALRDIGENDDGKNVSALQLWSPMQLFQAWIWERFPGLSPEPGSITRGLRLERWNKVRVLKNDDVCKAVDSAGDSFVWRPYSTPLNNWSFCANMYPKKGEWVSVGFEGGFDLETYARFVRTSELVGLESGCVENYFPHRVSMQFGLDQDIPCAVPTFRDSDMIAWTDYNRPIAVDKLYVPSKFFESDVTTQYLEWWRKSKMKDGNVSSPFGKVPIGLAEMLKIKKEINEADVPPGFSPKMKRVALDKFSDAPSPKRSKESRCRISPENKISDTDACSHSAPHIKSVLAEEEDSDDCDDHLPLSQLFSSKRSKRSNSSSTCPIIDLDSPLSSAGENESLQDVINNTGGNETIGCTGTYTKLTMEDQSAHNAQSPVQSPMKAGMILSSVSDSSGMDLLDRIARLQRIVDMVKAVKHS